MAWPACRRNIAHGHSGLRRHAWLILTGLAGHSCARSCEGDTDAIAQRQATARPMLQIDGIVVLPLGLSTRMVASPWRTGQAAVRESRERELPRNSPACYRAATARGGRQPRWPTP